MMLLQPLIDALDIATGNGWVELPESYGSRIYALNKSLSHRYVKRVPKPGGGYRYFYKVGHGGTVANADHFVEGASFKHEGGHHHITKTDGDKVTIRHDETGETKTITKAQLREKLTAHHGKELDEHRVKVHADLADAKKAGASPKQIARLEARAKAAGPAPKTGKKQKLAGIAKLDDRISKMKAEIESSPISAAAKAELLADLPEKNPKRKGDGYSDGSPDDEYDDYGDMVERTFKRDLSDAVERARTSGAKDGDKPKMSQAIADAAVAKDREKQRAAAAKFEAKQKAGAGQITQAKAKDALKSAYWRRDGAGWRIRTGDVDGVTFVENEHEYGRTPADRNRFYEVVWYKPDEERRASKTFNTMADAVKFGNTVRRSDGD